jgi:hypothetical protein
MMKKRARKLCSLLFFTAVKPLDRVFRYCIYLQPRSVTVLAPRKSQERYFRRHCFALELSKRQPLRHTNNAVGITLLLSIREFYQYVAILHFRYVLRMNLDNGCSEGN